MLAGGQPQPPYYSVIYAAIPLILAVVCVVLGRRMLTLLIILGYLEVEGFLKLVSNYNRFVHVGLDIIVLSLAGTMVLVAVTARRASLPDLPWVRLILLYVLWLSSSCSTRTAPASSRAWRRTRRT